MEEPTSQNSSKILVDHVGKIFTRDGANEDSASVEALHSVTLTVSDQEIVTIIGPSGCGKTTLLNLIAGFDAPTSGAVFVSGREVRSAGPDRAFVFQTPALFPWLTVYDNVTFGVRHTGGREKEYRGQAMHLLESVGLNGFERHFPYELSGGMKQRVQLARSMLSNPDVLLMDEPFGPLDWQTRSEMQLLLQEMWEEYHPTIIMVTHDVEEAIYVSDRVYVLRRRPGSVKLSLRVEFAKPRPMAIVTEPAFVELKEQLISAIREEGKSERR